MPMSHSHRADRGSVGIPPSTFAMDAFLNMEWAPGAVQSPLPPCAPSLAMAVSPCTSAQSPTEEPDDEPKDQADEVDDPDDIILADLVFRPGKPDRDGWRRA